VTVRGRCAGIPQNETEAMSLYNDAAARGAVAAAERSEALRLKSTNKGLRDISHTPIA